jgi:hypothetical protein
MNGCMHACIRDTEKGWGEGKRLCLSMLVHKQQSAHEHEYVRYSVHQFFLFSLVSDIRVQYIHLFEKLHQARDRGGSNFFYFITL